MLIWHTASIEGGQDSHGRPGWTLDGKDVIVTSMGCVVLQNRVEINWKKKVVECVQDKPDNLFHSQKSTCQMT